jgi:HEAT repeat protein
MRGTFAIVFLATVPAPVLAAEVEPGRADEQALAAAGLPLDGPGLVAFLRQRASADATPQRVAALIDRLGSAAPAEQERACRELVALGPAAIPYLRQAAADVDAGAAAELARRCLRALTTDAAALTAAAARLVARHRPEGAAEALLAALPGAEDEPALDELRQALAAVARRDGQPDPALLRALGDELPLRRAAAVDALCADGRPEPRGAFDRLLADPVPAVRLRAALALARAHDARAVTALIALLDELPFDLGRQAEEFLLTLAGDEAPRAPLAADETARRACRDAWAAWWRASDRPGLLDEFRRRTLTDVDRERGLALVRRLADDDFGVREKATAELKRLGPVLVPLLRQAANHADPEVRQRVAACLEAIEKDKQTPLSPTLCRLVALRKPAGAAEALLGFLPVAEDEATVHEVQAALNAVAADGASGPALLRALQDRAPARRAAAAEALCQELTAEARPAVVKLLADADPAVRLKVALALAGAGERAAVPVLVALVGELPAAQGAAAEEYLTRLAGDDVPELPAGDTEATRTRRRDAWAAWWRARGERVALVPYRLPISLNRYLGYTVLVQTQTNQIIELGADGKPRWTLNNLAGPQDVEVLPGDRVLVAEYNAQRVTERNLKGDILWQKQVPSWPVGVQRLPNGNTFITCRNLLVEVDRRGREVFTHSRPANDLMTARKLRDGRVVCLSANGSCFQLDAAGKEGKSFRVQGVSGHGNDVLPGGGVLVPVVWQNRVTEYGPDGRLVWEAAVVQPQSAVRLPNGHTLVASQQWPARLIELDRAGRQVAETPLAAHVHRARRR